MVGRIDLIMMEKRNGDYLKQQIDTTNQIVCLDKYPLKKENLYLIFRKDIDKDIIDVFNNNIKKIKEGTK